MSNFEPELGQLGFSNTEWQEHKVPELAIAALRALADEIERVEWNRTQEDYSAPTNNSGSHFKTDKFEMNAYCWCDGDAHPKGCPPNFKWRDVVINWYKYLGRGTSSNTELTPELINTMLEDCLESVQKLDKVTDLQLKDSDNTSEAL